MLGAPIRRQAPDYSPDGLGADPSANSAIVTIDITKAPAIFKPDFACSDTDRLSRLNFIIKILLTYIKSV